MSSSTTCAICLEPHEECSNVDGCAHEFCFVCIKTWSASTNLCPLCKAEFGKISIKPTAAGAENSGATRKRRKVALTHRVPRRIQRAEYDSEEEQRLLDVSDNENDEDDEITRRERRAHREAYRCGDGFVLRDQDEVDAEDDDYSDGDGNATTCISLDSESSSSEQETKVQTRAAVAARRNSDSPIIVYSSAWRNKEGPVTRSQSIVAK